MADQRPSTSGGTSAPGWTPVNPSEQWRRALLRRGRNRLVDERRDFRDRMLAADPGQSQLYLGLRVIAAIGTTLLWEWLLATATASSPTVPLLLGGVVAMVVSSNFRESSRRVTVRAAAPALPAALLGFTVATLAAPLHTLSLVLFVAVSFVAVFVRRFGGAWVSYGLLGWQCYFFGLFLGLPTAQLPLLVGVIGIAAVWSTLLIATVLFEDPAARLRRTVSTLRAQARSTVSAAIDVLDDPDDERAVRALRSHLVRLSEVALLFDGQLSEARALPPGVPPARLRRWVVRVEIGVDDLVGAIQQLADAPDRSAATTARVRATLRAIGWEDTAVALRSARQLADDPQVSAAERRIGRVCDYLVRVVAEWTSGTITEPMDAGPGADDDDFEPVVTLRSGKLPGTAGVAETAVTDATAPRWSPARLPLTTRQAIQAAVAATLAIVVGHWISPQRYYWAVIAAFLMFTGTATASETVRRSAARIGGTAAGLVAAVLLADVTAGDTAAEFGALLGALALAWYLLGRSYAGMIFGITIALGQLYGLLHSFSDRVLVLRLEETLAGAAIGALVGLLVLPASALRALRVARRQLLQALADLLDDAAGALSGGEPATDLLTHAVALDAATRQASRTTDSLIRGRFFGSDRTGLRHRVAVLTTAAALGRSIGAQIAEPAPIDPDTATAIARALTEIATDARRLALVPNLATPPLPAGPELAERVGASLVDVPASLLRQRVRMLGDTLGLLTPRGR